MKKTKAKIKYFDLYGLRKEKGEFLESHSVKNTKWRELELKEPNFWFVPKDMRGERLYKKFISVKDIFIFNNVGGKPGNDSILVGDNNHELKVKINQFVQLLKFDKSKALTEADKNLLKIIDEFEIEDENLISYNYRPFDIRQTYYDERIYTRPVSKLKRQFDKENVCLLVTKIVTTHPFQHAFVSEIFPDVIFLSNRGSTNAYIFPLYLYNTSTYAPKKEETKSSYKNLMLFDKPKEKESNIKTEIIEKLSKAYKKKIAPEEIFYYIYTVLYSNVYRKKYNEFLKIDFPKIPFTDDIKLFNKVSKLGKELADLHLLKSKKLENNKSVKFPAVGDNKAEKREYKNNKIYINDKQYFTGITPEVWNYHIGGYQVLDKWLKDRKEKNLSREEVDHYLKIITALKLTIKFQKEIDELYGGIEKSLIL